MEGLERVSNATGRILRYEGSLSVEERNIAVSITFPCLDFTIFPKIFLVNRQRDLQGVAAHIDEGDSVCYAAPGSLVLDRYDPAGTTLNVLHHFKRTLSAGIRGSTAVDVRAEFPQHWGGTAFLYSLPDNADDGPACFATIFRDGEPQVSILIRDSKELIQFGVSRPERSKNDGDFAWLLRLQGELDLPDGITPPTSLTELLRWAAALESGLEDRLIAAIRHKRFFKKSPSIFFLAPNGCVGVKLRLPALLRTAIQTRHFQNSKIFKNAGMTIVNRWAGSRMDQGFVVRRNLGNSPSLAGRRIVLVGCGTIGSHLAKFLVQSGAGKDRGYILSLIDPDVLKPGNIGRHWLGPEHLRRNKSDACRDELLRQFPGFGVKSYPSGIMEHVSLLHDADLVIDATGEEAVSFAINDLLVSRNAASPDALYVWLSGNGAAAQALFVRGNPSAEGACRKCLHPVLSEAPLFDPILEEWGAREVPAACGDAGYLPYGVAAPAIAAGLASKMCLEWAAANVPRTLRTVRVDHLATRDLRDCSPQRTPGCPGCSRGQ